MTQPQTIAAIRSVHDAAVGLTLACTEIVGPVEMSVSRATVSTLGEPVPDAMMRCLKQLARKDKK